MKIRILSRDFNDKDFWGHFDKLTAIDYFIPNHQHWESKGVVFTIEDLTDHHRYQRSIRIYAEGPESVLVELGLIYEHK